MTPYLIGAGALLLVAFLHWELRRASLNKPVLLERSLLSNRGFLVGSLTNTMGGLAIASFMFIVPVFLEDGLRFTPFQTGLAVLPASVGIFVGSLVAPRLEAWMTLYRLAQLGVVIMGLGFWLYARVLHPDLTVSELILPYLAIGIGAGVMMMELCNRTLSAVEPGLASEASGLDNALRKLGSA
jgi:predicted MFS family arabinose efflux permease